MPSPRSLGEIYCCDADALITIRNAKLLLQLGKLASSGVVKVPQAVFEEVRTSARSNLFKQISTWNTSASVITPADMPILLLIPEIERRYGKPFSIGGLSYRGLWASERGRSGADSVLVATAKANQWTVISNDQSVHGACLFEQVVCRRWEELARVMRPPPRPSQPKLI